AAGPAGGNREGGTAVRRDVLCRDPLDPGQRGRVTFQRGKELLHIRRGALDLGEYAVGVVAHMAAEAESGRQRVDERPEPDALDRAFHPDRHPHARSAHSPSLARWYPQLPDDDHTTRDRIRAAPAGGPAGPCLAGL